MNTCGNCQICGVPLHPASDSPIACCFCKYIATSRLATYQLLPALWAMHHNVDEGKNSSRITHKPGFRLPTAQEEVDLIRRRYAESAIIADTCSEEEGNS